MAHGARGVEVVVAGKVKGGRAKAMKFKEGYILKTGDAKNKCVESSTFHAKLKQGVLGVKVTIMLPHDPTGAEGVVQLQPDVVTLFDVDKF